ncbi:uncharacterized protein LOC131023416 [Salvia miltiorrhiza]|uniref:uncharacterized protein LOC131000926 n=1 Tax=Salvia miltiorrhiza TaxID=226208 RepID=UPI0025AB7025|nr:uncharacterized protein LOC131000926 [Salvia miltiorrhiza]XP_057795068.1 uncharacterized protein LOC131011309 [Salvia miltiorrhiza]XP_057808941.1 uncharacterized protein LOC131023416 [Salvia miltiorrhiza]
MACAKSSSSGGSAMFDTTTKCYCGSRVVLMTSQTQQNPGRRFICCPKKDIKAQCRFWHWVDPETPIGEAEEEDDGESKLTFWIGEYYRQQQYLEADMMRIRQLEAEIKHLKKKKKDNKKLFVNMKQFMYGACFGVLVYAVSMSLIL